MLAVAKREVKDPHREVSRWSALASTSGPDQARAYLHAARIAHAVKLDDIYRTLLQTAINRRLAGDFSLLLEDRLLARGNTDELLGFYRTDSKRSPTTATGSRRCGRPRPSWRSVDANPGSRSGSCVAASSTRTAPS